MFSVTMRTHAYFSFLASAEYCRDLDYMQFIDGVNYDFQLEASSNQDQAQNAMHQSNSYWSSDHEDLQDNTPAL